MATETSQQVMALLKELSMLKEADAHEEAGTVDAEPDAHQLRERRKQEIVEEIKTLAEQKKSLDETTSAGA